uniref:Uncharacterized protein n=1 Tax=Arundo donax TaxID=35708 RepID=A0A0A9GXI1_ARUDO
MQEKYCLFVQTHNMSSKLKI